MTGSEHAETIYLEEEGKTMKVVHYSVKQALKFTFSDLCLVNLHYDSLKVQRDFQIYLN